MIVARPDPALSARLVDIRPLYGVRAGSALLWVDGRLLVVQDDALAVAWVDPVSGRAEPMALEGAGEALIKAKKPDFEAAFAGPGRSITILGSGSTPARHRAARIDPGGSVRFLDCTPLFRAVTEALGCTPNVEGAVLDGEVLRLFHRGSGAEPSSIVDVPSTAIGAARVKVLAASPCDLGAARGVPLTFTDAAPFRAGVVYLAVAEDTPNAVDDGPVVGAAIGLLQGGIARYTLLHEADGSPTTRKVEGLAFNPGTGTGYLVTDPDDPMKPAELCIFTLEGVG